MDTTTTTPQQQAQLLRGKTREFQNLPGNILGLDGWILRTLPKEYRNQFLAGYEKLLRVALHPDRARFDEARSSREEYLKAMSEAVAYLQSGEMEYELATDHVPTKRNWVVELRNQVHAQDKTLDRLDRRHTEALQKLIDLRKEQERIVTWTARMNERTRNMRYSAMLQTRALQDMLRRVTPTPVNTENYRLSGWEVDFRKWTPDHPDLIALLDKLAYWASHGQVPRSGHEARDRWTAEFRKLMERTSPAWKAECRQGEFREGGRAQRVLGSLPLLNLAEHIKAWFNFQGRRPSLSSVCGRLRRMHVPQGYKEFDPMLLDYLFPFVAADELVAVLERGNPSRFRFILIKGIGV